MLTMAPLGATSTYAAAQVVVAALARGDEPAAFEAMGAFTGPQLTEVRNKSIALGADPATVDMMVDALTGEVIEVSGEAPVQKAMAALAPSGKFPWGLILLLAALGGGYWYYRRRR